MREGMPLKEFTKNITIMTESTVILDDMRTGEIMIGEDTKRKEGMKRKEDMKRNKDTKHKEDMKKEIIMDIAITMSTMINSY
jgi:hypothetical protein